MQYSFALFIVPSKFNDFPGGSDGKASAYNVGDPGSFPGLGMPSEEGNGNPLQYSCLKKSHGWSSVVGYSPWACKDSDMTERLHFDFQNSMSVLCWQHISIQIVNFNKVK